MLALCCADGGMTAATADTCRLYSRHEYLAPLERQLSAEAALNPLPTAVIAVVAEYMVPRLLFLMNETQCVVTRAPCALFASVRPSPPGEARQQQQQQNAAQREHGAFPVLHRLSMDMVRQSEHSGISRDVLEGAAALPDPDPAAGWRPGVGAGTCLEDARRRVWVCMGTRIAALGEPMDHEAWWLGLAAAPPAGKKTQKQQKRSRCDEDGTDAAVRAPPCEWQWRAGPRLSTPWMRLTGVHFGDSVAAATIRSSGVNGGDFVLSSTAMCSAGSPAAPVTSNSIAGRPLDLHPPPDRTKGVASFPTNTVAGVAGDIVTGAVGAAIDGAAIAGTAHADGLAVAGMEWSRRDTHFPMSSAAPTTRIRASRILAWGERLYVYSFRTAVHRGTTLQLYAMEPATASAPGAGWTAVGPPAPVWLVPDLFVAAPADKSGETRVLVLGCLSGSISAARNPLSAWTASEWRLPFSEECVAAAFADDWLYVVGVHSGSWASRWTPHHEGWTGPEWMRLPVGHTADTAALVVL